MKRMYKFKDRHYYKTKKRLEHAEEWIRNELDARGLSHIEVRRVDGLEGDLDGTRKIVGKIIYLWNVVKKDE